MVESTHSAVNTKKREFRPISAYKEAISKFTRIISTVNENDWNTSTTKPDQLVEEYFEYVAFSGRPSFSWEQIRLAFIWKLKTVMETMHKSEIEMEPVTKVKERLQTSEYIRDLKAFILEKAKSFDGTPFTVQRLCELLVTPNRHYHVAEKFLRALEKNINVVTTVTESGDRISGIDPGETDNRESPIPVERNFIVSVDEVDDPLLNGFSNEEQIADVTSKETLSDESTISVGHISYVSTSSPIKVAADSDESMNSTTSSGGAGQVATSSSSSSSSSSLSSTSLQPDDRTFTRLVEAHSSGDANSEELSRANTDPTMSMEVE